VGEVEEEMAVEDHADDDLIQNQCLIQEPWWYAEALDHLLMAVEPYEACSSSEGSGQPFCSQQKFQPSKHPVESGVWCSRL
jgi:hypothetical protein